MPFRFEGAPENYYPYRHVPLTFRRPRKDIDLIQHQAHHSRDHLILMLRLLSAGHSFDEAHNRASRVFPY